MHSPSEEIRKQANEIRGVWQGRVLEAAQGRMMLVVASMLAHAYPDHFHVLLITAKPMLWNADLGVPRPPFLASIGKINHSGRIVADYLPFEGGLKLIDKVVFADTDDFQNELRKLADRVKLPDDDRVQFFTCAQNWIGADRRIDPTTGEKRLVN